MMMTKKMEKKGEEEDDDNADDDDEEEEEHERGKSVETKNVTRTKQPVKRKQQQQAKMQCKTIDQIEYIHKEEHKQQQRQQQQQQQPPKKQVKTWIVKPDNLCEGQGIFLVRSLQKIPATQHVLYRDICPMYVGACMCACRDYSMCMCIDTIHGLLFFFLVSILTDIMICFPSVSMFSFSSFLSLQPYLILSRKFDLRIYVLLRCVSPLCIYVYDDGLVRFCSEAYDPPSSRNLVCVAMCLCIFVYACIRNMRDEEKKRNDGGKERKRGGGDFRAIKTRKIDSTCHLVLDFNFFATFCIWLMFLSVALFFLLELVLFSFFSLYVYARITHTYIIYSCLHIYVYIHIGKCIFSSDQLYTQ